MVPIDTKEKLIAIAVERFLALGPDGVSLRAIAKRAGITPMAVYRHYDDKEALLLAVIERGFASYASYLDVGVPAADPVDHLKWLAGRVFDFAHEQGAYFELMFLTARTARGLSDRIRITSIHAPTYRVAREALRDAGYREVTCGGTLKAATTDMLAYCIGFCAFFISGALPVEADEARARFLQGFSRLLVRLLNTDARSVSEGDRQ